METGLHWRAEDWGALVEAGRLENLPHRLFPAWRAPLAVSALLWLLLLALQLGRSHLCPGGRLGWAGRDLLAKLFTQHINEATTHCTARDRMVFLQLERVCKSKVINV